jgi:hypothetical protein
MRVQRNPRAVPARAISATGDPLAMTDQTDIVRAGAEDVCDALVAGDVERAIGYLSDELRRNLGEVMALLPLPAVEASIASIERGGSGAYVLVFDVVGETDQSEIETRWKDRNGQPRIVEVSHRSRIEREPTPEDGGNGEGTTGPGDAAGPGGPESVARASTA